MRNSGRGAGTLGSAVLAAAVLASCSTARQPDFEPALRQSRQYFQAGELQKAMDAGAAARQRYPSAEAVREEFIRTLEGINRQAEAALAAGDPASAERLFWLLLNNTDKYKDIEKSLSFSAAGLGRRIVICRTALEQRRMAHHLRAGEYDKALAVPRNLPPSVLRSRGLAESYSRIMEEIKRRADGAAASRDYADAGRAYAVLARHYADAVGLGLKLPFSKEALDEGVEICRAELTRQGLEHYRKGELSRAVSVWQELLLFDPDNAEIRKAVETAREQQKGFQKK